MERCRAAESLQPGTRCHGEDHAEPPGSCSQVRCLLRTPCGPSPPSSHGDLETSTLCSSWSAACCPQNRGRAPARPAALGALAPADCLTAPPGPVRPRNPPPRPALLSTPRSYSQHRLEASQAIGAPDTRPQCLLMSYPPVDFTAFSSQLLCERPGSTQPSAWPTAGTQRLLQEWRVL